VAANPTTFTGSQWGAKHQPGTTFQGPTEDKSHFSLTSYQAIHSTRQFEEAKQAWEDVNDTAFLPPVQGRVHDTQGGQRFYGVVRDINDRVVVEIDQPYAAAAAMHKAADNSLMYPGFLYATNILSDAPLGPQDMRKYKGKATPTYFARCTRQLTDNQASPRDVRTDNLMQAMDSDNDYHDRL
jgi:hypothetical protein